MVPALDAPVTPPPPPRVDDTHYVFAASDIRPRTAKEIELCEAASHFDWQYTGSFALGFAASLYANISPLKNNGNVGMRLLGPALIGFTWGGFLSGGYLSLPKCDPLFTQGPPPEGNVRSPFPLAVAITLVAGVTAPMMDYGFLGPVKLFWAVEERSARVFVAAGFGMLGAIFPYILPPRTWSARKQLDRLHVDGTAGGAAMTYTLRF